MRSSAAGKGDDFRPVNKTKFDTNYVRIDWEKEKEKEKDNRKIEKLGSKIRIIYC